MTEETTLRAEHHRPGFRREGSAPMSRHPGGDRRRLGELPPEGGTPTGRELRPSGSPAFRRSGGRCDVPGEHPDSWLHPPDFRSRRRKAWRCTHERTAADEDCHSVRRLPHAEGGNLRTEWQSSNEMYTAGPSKRAIDLRRGPPPECGPLRTKWPPSNEMYTAGPSERSLGHRAAPVVTPSFRRASSRRRQRI
jgi:hypothetical protein